MVVGIVDERTTRIQNSTTTNLLEYRGYPHRQHRLQTNARPMSIHTKTDAAADLTPLLDHEPKDCFLCSKPLFGNRELSSGGFVHWQGATGAISLHQFCAEKLGIHLIQDARSLAARTGKKVKPTGSTVTDVSAKWFALPRPTGN